MKKYVLLIVMLLSAAGFCAQFDTAYIEPYPYKYDMMMLTRWDFVSVREHGILYRPNNPPKLGGKFSVKNWPSIVGSINVTDKADPDLPKTTSYDLQLHLYLRKFMLDMYLQSYEGFYSGGGRQQADITSHPEFGIMRVGADLSYIFNNERFSGRAAFLQKERQLKSAGSFILGTGAYYFGLSTNEYADFEYRQFGGNLGYAYSYVINQNFFATAVTTGGIFYTERINSRENDDPSASINGSARLSTGYNTNNWCIFLTAHYNAHRFHRNLILNAGTFQIAYIARFY